MVLIDGIKINIYNSFHITVIILLGNFEPHILKTDSKEVKICFMKPKLYLFI